MKNKLAQKNKTFIFDLKEDDKDFLLKPNNFIKLSKYLCNNIR
jgi:hypothetical protein